MIGSCYIWIIIAVMHRIVILDAGRRIIAYPQCTILHDQFFHFLFPLHIRNCSHIDQKGILYMACIFPVSCAGRISCSQKAVHICAAICSKPAVRCLFLCNRSAPADKMPHGKQRISALGQIIFPLHGSFIIITRCTALCICCISLVIEIISKLAF